MTYIPVTEAQSNPFAPGTSELFKQLRDNPIAIAGGLEGAPRNVPLSLNLMLGGSFFALSGMIPVEFLGLEGHGSLLLVSNTEPFEGVLPGIEMSFSLNNGGTWSTWVNIPVGLRHIHLTGGFQNGAQIGSSGFGSGPSPVAGANAVRIRKTTTGGSANVALIGMGRT